MKSKGKVVYEVTSHYGLLLNLCTLLVHFSHFDPKILSSEYNKASNLVVLSFMDFNLLIAQEIFSPNHQRRCITHHNHSYLWLNEISSKVTHGCVISGATRPFSLCKGVCSLASLYTRHDSFVTMDPSHDNSALMAKWPIDTERTWRSSSAQ